MGIAASLEQQKASGALRKKQGYQNASQWAHASPHMHNVGCNSALADTGAAWRW